MATDPLAAFIWGSGGAKLSPEQVAERRRMAGELAKKEIPGLGHWAASLNQGLTGFLGGRERRIADEAETLGREGFQSQWDSVFGGVQGSIDPVAAALVGGGAASAPASMPTGENAAYIRQGMIQRGLPEHVADAFLLNMQDESGLNPGINEAKPTVPGSRGGYGLYQLTGPRRRAYEAFAQQKGIPLDSIDGQLDFLMGELSGSEAAAAKSILSAPDTGSAAAAIVNKFLRPAESHRARRANAYMGGSYKLPNMTSPVGAPVDPAMQMAEADQMGGAIPANMQMPAGGAEQAIAQALAQPQPQMPPPQAPMPPQAPAMGAGQPSMQQLMALASNGWSNPAQQSIIQSLIGQQMQAQQQANDPLRALQIRAAEQGIQRGDLELQQLLNPTPDPWAGVKVINDQVVGMGDGAPQVMGDFRSPDLTPLMQNLAAAGLEPGSPQYAQAIIDSVTKPQTQVTVGGGPEMGKLSNDYSYVIDPATGLPKIDPETGLPTAAPVPGSPAFVAQQQAEAATASQQGAGLSSDLDKAATTLATTQSVLDLLDDSGGQPVTGTLSKPFAALSGTPAGKLRSYVSTLQSGVALGAMQRLKEASATGATGFGALNGKELDLLISDTGALDPDNTEPEIFRATVERIQDRTKRVVADIRRNVSPERIAELGLTELLNAVDPKGGADYAADTPPDGWGGDPALWRFMPPEDRALW